MKLCHKNKLSSFYFFRREAIINEVKVAHSCSSLCDAMDSPWNSPGQNTGVARPRGATPRPRSGAEAGRTPCPKSSGWEELPGVRGQGRWPGRASPRPHARGQRQRPGGPTPRPRSGGCPGTGGPRGAIPRWRSGRAAVRRYPLSKVRSSGCALLEQP